VSLGSLNCIQCRIRGRRRNSTSNDHEVTFQSQWLKRLLITHPFIPRARIDVKMSRLNVPLLHSNYVSAMAIMLLREIGASIRWRCQSACNVLQRQ